MDTKTTIIKYLDTAHVSNKDIPTDLRIKVMELATAINEQYPDHWLKANAIKSLIDLNNDLRLLSLEQVGETYEAKEKKQEKHNTLTVSLFNCKMDLVMSDGVRTVIRGLDDFTLEDVKVTLGSMIDLLDLGLPKPFHEKQGKPQVTSDIYCDIIHLLTVLEDKGIVIKRNYRTDYESLSAIQCDQSMSKDITVVCKNTNLSLTFHSGIEPLEATHSLKSFIGMLGFNPSATGESSILKNIISGLYESKFK